MKRIFFTILRSACVILIIYAALVLYIVMREESTLNFAKKEVELKRYENGSAFGDTIFVIGQLLGAARAAEIADSLNNAGTPAKLELIKPIYNEKEYLHDRYGVFYPIP
ncbi:hypothetical protein AGMMS49938_11150 [Fibrobacterales bacterium]|nr:hypothetical protein AGMMS49938_11150 [Fibrobacterales bacterium]